MWKVNVSVNPRPVVPPHALQHTYVYKIAACLCVANRYVRRVKPAFRIPVSLLRKKPRRNCCPQSCLNLWMVRSLRFKPANKPIKNSFPQRLSAMSISNRDVMVVQIPVKNAPKRPDVHVIPMLCQSRCSWGFGSSCCSPSDAEHNVATKPSLSDVA